MLVNVFKIDAKQTHVECGDKDLEKCEVSLLYVSGLVWVQFDKWPINNSIQWRTLCD